MDKLEWVRDSKGKVPKGAVCGGYNAIDEEPLFVGRAVIDRRELIGGKVSGTHGCCFYSSDGAEHKAENYEVLVNTGNHVHLEWYHDHYGKVPDGAVEGGFDGKERRPHFVGRCSHFGDTIPGKVVPRDDCMYITYHGNEIEKREYDVLVQRN